MPAAWLDGDLTWIMSCTAYRVLITLIIIDFTGLWIKLWRNTFASHYFPWWSSAFALWADDGGWSGGWWGPLFGGCGDEWCPWHSWDEQSLGSSGSVMDVPMWKVILSAGALVADVKCVRDLPTEEPRQVNQVIFPFLTSPWILWIKDKNRAKLKQMF